MSLKLWLLLPMQKEDVCSLIADFCKDMGLIEKYGSGIGRICNYFKKDGLPEPKFGNISDGFQVTVFGEDIDKVTPIVAQGEQNLLNIIKKNNKITRGELADALNVSLNTVKTVIWRLKKKGVLERIGDNRTGCWKIIKQ